MGIFGYSFFNKSCRRLSCWCFKYAIGHLCPSLWMLIFSCNLRLHCSLFEFLLKSSRIIQLPWKRAGLGTSHLFNPRLLLYGWFCVHSELNIFLSAKSDPQCVTEVEDEWITKIIPCSFPILFLASNAKCLYFCRTGVTVLLFLLFYKTLFYFHFQSFAVKNQCLCKQCCYTYFLIHV